jgi:hypothetical protein
MKLVHRSLVFLPRTWGIIKIKNMGVRVFFYIGWFKISSLILSGFWLMERNRESK